MVKKEPGTETVKQEPGTETVKIEPGKDIKKEPDMEEGQIADDKPLNEILRGKNPIVWCNEQSKYRSLKMDWEQISETGTNFIYCIPFFSITYNPQQNRPYFACVIVPQQYSSIALSLSSRNYSPSRYFYTNFINQVPPTTRLLHGP